MIHCKFKEPRLAVVIQSKQQSEELREMKNYAQSKMIKEMSERDLPGAVGNSSYNIRGTVPNIEPFLVTRKSCQLRGQRKRKRKKERAIKINSVKKIP